MSRNTVLFCSIQKYFRNKINVIINLIYFLLQRKLFEKKLAYRALLAQEKQILPGFGETKLDCSSSILSEDSGFVSTPDLCREPSFLNSKSQSMMSVTSVSSTGFCISDVPGNQSVEHIASLKV